MRGSWGPEPFIFPGVCFASGARERRPDSPPDMAAVVRAWEQAQASAGAGAQPRNPCSPAGYGVYRSESSHLKHHHLQKDLQDFFDTHTHARG